MRGGGLVIERLDSGGTIAASSPVWVLGGVPMGGRAYFSASVPEAAAYRVRVLSFEWAGRGSVLVTEAGPAVEMGAA